MDTFNEEVQNIYKILQIRPKAIICHKETTRSFVPKKLYNADETGITILQDPGKILAIKGQKGLVLLSVEKEIGRLW